MLRKKGGGRLMELCRTFLINASTEQQRGFRPLLGAAENKDVFLSRSPSQVNRLQSCSNGLQGLQENALSADAFNASRKINTSQLN